MLRLSEVTTSSNAPFTQPLSSNEIFRSLPPGYNISKQVLDQVPHPAGRRPRWSDSVPDAHLTPASVVPSVRPAGPGLPPAPESASPDPSSPRSAAGVCRRSGESGGGMYVVNLHKALASLATATLGVRRPGEVRVSAVPGSSGWFLRKEVPGAEASGRLRHDPGQGSQGHAVQDAVGELHLPPGNPQNSGPRPVQDLLPVHGQHAVFRPHAAAPVLQGTGFLHPPARVPRDPLPPQPGVRPNAPPPPDPGGPPLSAPNRALPTSSSDASFETKGEQAAAGEVAAGGGHPGVHAGHGGRGGPAPGDRGDDHGARTPAAGEPQTQRQQAGRQRDPGGRNHLRAGGLHREHGQEVVTGDEAGTAGRAGEDEDRRTGRGYRPPECRRGN
uniref:Uncharacterized protein n=1 Tax=Ornithorhynchus anatinus TaxID=9258 RepID=A0A6I8N455_ORNAN